MTGPIATIREALRYMASMQGRPFPKREAALTALTQVEHQLAAIEENANRAWDHVEAAETALAEANQEANRLNEEANRLDEQVAAAVRRANDLQEIASAAQAMADSAGGRNEGRAWLALRAALDRQEQR